MCVGAGSASRDARRIAVSNMRHDVGHVSCNCRKRTSAARASAGRSLVLMQCSGGFAEGLRSLQQLRLCKLLHPVALHGNGNGLACLLHLEQAVLPVS